MSLVPALSSDFGISPALFFVWNWSLHFVKILVLVLLLTFFKKKKQNYWYWSLHFIKILVLVSALCKNIGIGATWCEMIGPRGTPLVLCFF